MIAWLRRVFRRSRSEETEAEFHRRVYYTTQNERGRWLAGCCARCGWQRSAGVHNSAPHTHAFVEGDHWLWHVNNFGLPETV